MLVPVSWILFCHFYLSLLGDFWFVVLGFSLGVGWVGFFRIRGTSTGHSIHGADAHTQVNKPDEVLCSFPSMSNNCF